MEDSKPHLDKLPHNLEILSIRHIILLIEALIFRDAY